MFAKNLQSESNQAFRPTGNIEQGDKVNTTNKETNSECGMCYRFSSESQERGRGTWWDTIFWHLKRLKRQKTTTAHSAICEPWLNLGSKKQKWWQMTFREQLDNIKKWLLILLTVIMGWWFFFFLVCSWKCILKFVRGNYMKSEIWFKVFQQTSTQITLFSDKKMLSKKQKVSTVQCVWEILNTLFPFKDIHNEH